MGATAIFMICVLNKTENPFSLQDDEKIDILYFIENSWQIPWFLFDDHS